MSWIIRTAVERYDASSNRWWTDARKFGAYLTQEAAMTDVGAAVGFVRDSIEPAPARIVATVEERIAPAPAVTITYQFHA
jgi:hypothetical protein